MCSRGQPSGERRRLIPAGQMAGRLNQQHVFPLGKGEGGREGGGALGGEAHGLKAEAAGAGTPPAGLLSTGWGEGLEWWGAGLWMTLWKSVGLISHTCCSRKH